MFKFLLGFAVVIGFAGTGFAQNKFKDDADKAAYLQDISVTIHAGGAQGSGVIKTVKDTNYVWTCGHVVQHLRSTRTVIDSKSGSTKTIVEFADAKIVKELIEDGRAVGKLEMDAEVLRYSDAENGEDLSLLRVRKKNFIKTSVNFYLDSKIPPVGSKLLHVGSLLGQMGSNSLTSGVMSQHGRVYATKVYDQSTCAAFPGSSGGGVYLESDAKYVGMIVRGAGETFNLMVPVRRMELWAKHVKIGFTMDDSAVPTEEELRKSPIEDSGVVFHADPAKIAPPHAREKEFPFLIYLKDTQIPLIK